MTQQIAFGAVAVLMAFGAIQLVTTKNVVRGALWLVIVLFGAAVTFLLFLAEFVAWVQVLIYIGAVVVLLLFGLMLTRAPIGRTALDNQQRALAAFVSAGIFLLTSTVLWNAFDGKSIKFKSPFSTSGLGQSLFTTFVLPFEVVSILLLAALVGAVVLAKKDD